MAVSRGSKLCLIPLNCIRVQAEVMYVINQIIKREFTRENSTGKYVTRVIYKILIRKPTRP